MTDPKHSPFEPGSETDPRSWKLVSLHGHTVSDPDGTGLVIGYWTKGQGMFVPLMSFDEADCDHDNPHKVANTVLAAVNAYEPMRELLAECRAWFDGYLYDDEGNYELPNLDRIDAILGE